METLGNLKNIHVSEMGKYIYWFQAFNGCVIIVIAHPIFLIQVLCVNNAGLDNHVTQDEVYQLFSCHGNICDVIMLPRKPYAFVCFLSEEDADSAYQSLNGYKLAATGDRREETTLYISFVSQGIA